VIRYSSGIGDSGANDMMLQSMNQNWLFGRPEAAVCVILQESASRGEMLLRSTDPSVDPHFELGLLEAPIDLDRMVDGVERAKVLINHPAVRAIATGPAELPTTPHEIIERMTDVMHLCSTVRMGAEDSPAAVVDPSCRVLGIEGLRVIDASIMPHIVRANLNLTVIAMAELMAERLRSNGRG
jgi:choline dehydrogenase-like flavoprotein